MTLKDFQSDRGRLKVLLWVLIGLGLAARLYLVVQPIEVLVARYAADDAFYYFTIARHIALGHGPTFDGLYPTNGFHPLYLILLVPIYLLSPENLELNVRLSLTLAAVFNVATAWPLYWMLRRLLGSQATMVGSIAWLFNPSVISITLQGVESSVYVFLVAVSVWLYLDYRMESQPAAGDRRPVLVGIALGFVFLARSDAVFLILAMLLDMVLSRRGWRAIAQVAGACGIVLAPWFAWNWASFGTLMQVSGAAIYYSTHLQGSVLGGNPTSDFVLSSVRILFITGVMISQQLILGLFGLTTWLHLRRPSGGVRPGAVTGGSRTILFLLLYAALLLAFYAWVLNHIQFWYLLPTIFVATIWVALLYDQVRVRARQTSAQHARALEFVGVAVILGVLGFAWWGWEAGRIALYVPQYDGYRVAQWLANSTAPDARVGSWNSGILGYFSGRTVVNLDGVVNNKVYQHVAGRKSTFDLDGEWEYVSQAGISYITDYENILQPLSGDAYAQALRLVHEFPSVTTMYQVRIYQVVPGATPSIGVRTGTGY